MIRRSPPNYEATDDAGRILRCSHLRYFRALFLENIRSRLGLSCWFHYIGRVSSIYFAISRESISAGMDAPDTYEAREPLTDIAGGYRARHIIARRRRHGDLITLDRQ